MRVVPFTRRADLHPSWCGQGHVCSHDRPGGEHRSSPLTVDTDTARIVATRIRTQAGRDRIELRVVIDLPADRDHARAIARRVVTRLYHLLTNTRLTGANE